jgi:hypothetical protein
MYSNGISANLRPVVYMQDPASPAMSSKHHKVSGSTDLMTIFKQRKKQVQLLLFIVSISPPQHRWALSEPASLSAGKIIVAPRMSIDLNFRLNLSSGSNGQRARMATSPNNGLERSRAGTDGSRPCVATRIITRRAAEIAN